MASVEIPAAVMEDERLSNAEWRCLMTLFYLAEADRVTAPTPIICRRARVASNAHLSRLTNALARKGWLVKKRLGNTGRVQYRLRVPYEQLAA